MKRRLPPPKPSAKAPARKIPAKAPRSSSAINVRQQQLAQQESAVKRQMLELEREIAEAPQRHQEKLKLQRDELLRNYEQRRGTDFFSSLPDKRHHTLNSTIPVQRRRRKGEQRAAQYQFLALVVMLILVIYFVWRAIPFTFNR